MEHKEQEQGLLGVVADIIKVEKAYEVAVETALGGSIQNIVTDSEETAKKMIAFLKKKPVWTGNIPPSDQRQFRTEIFTV